ncbi:CPBP family glutamic-type intramembrane protease [Parasphingorhabdus sp.]|uniref:CPBP family glutamic-type intramembrane protease n=1 Tax=Parasphingorhabdus sp. TaxID=2709688 RepID=UPI0030029984
MFEPNSTIGWSIGRLRSTALDLLAFVRAPTLGPRESDRGRPVADVAWLFLLNCLIVLAIAMVLFPMMMLFGVEMSSDMSALFDRPLWQMVLIVIIVGPIAEELMFRVWIVGNPRWLILVCGLVTWIGGSSGLEQSGLVDWNQGLAIGLGAAIALASLAGLVRLWKAPVPSWYRSIFPLVFWGQALLFGLVHVFNYTGANPATLLPFILPQLVGGLIWGYARIRYGWWSNILMHMAYNLLATSGLLYVLVTGPGVG